MYWYSAIKISIYISIKSKEEENFHFVSFVNLIFRLEKHANEISMLHVHEFKKKKIEKQIEI